MSFRNLLASGPDPVRQPFAGRYLALVILSGLVLTLLVGGLRFISDQSWKVILGYVALASAGMCLVIGVLAVQISEADYTRRMQFNLRRVLVLFIGLGMLLAGMTKLFRLSKIDFSEEPPSESLSLVLLLGALAVPILLSLIHLLSMLIALANVIIRLPAVRRMLARRGNGTTNDSAASTR